MYAEATTATASFPSVADRYTTEHFAKRALGPAGSMCCRHAGDATNASAPPDQAAKPQ